MFRLLVFCSVCVAVVFTDVINLSRSLKTEVKCSSQNVSLIYTRADGPNDTFHYLLTTFGVPSLLAAKTDRHTNISISCEKLFNVSTSGNSINFTKKPDYVYAVSFNKLFEYNDTDDDADLDKLTNTTAWNMIDLSSNLTWSNTTAISNLSDHEVKFMVDSDSSNLKLNKNGSLSLKFKHFTNDGEATKLPHLQYTANLTQMQLILDNFAINYVNSRYVLEMSMIVKKSERASQIFIHKSIDDEHTPGVFQLFNWNVAGDNQTKGAFLQWKPVCYRWKPPSITNSTQLKSYALVNSSLDTKEFSLAYAYFGKEAITVTSTNISFGLSNDKFYKQTNYTSWTVSIGYGKPPTEAISLLIILIISIGLGIPMILIIFGGVFTCVKRRKQSDSNFGTEYTKIQ